MYNNLLPKTSLLPTTPTNDQIHKKLNRLLREQYTTELYLADQTVTTKAPQIRLRPP
jgi:hypothetical protein